MSELSRRGVRDYSELSFGEGLSRIARHEITLLCIKGIRKELSNNPAKGKRRGRGRPTSPMGLLSQRLGVHSDTIKRWADIRQPQACDFNTTKLAEIAYKCDPQGLVLIIEQDLSRRKKTIEKWFKGVEANYPAPPYVVNRHPIVGKGRPERATPNRSMTKMSVLRETGFQTDGNQMGPPLEIVVKKKEEEE